VRSTDLHCSLGQGLSNKIIPLGERHLRHVLQEYVAHYHHERPHQGLESRILLPGPEVGSNRGRLRCRKRVGGLLRYYYRAAA